MSATESRGAADADVIIVGSGPSGVSAAFPLVESGLRVMLLDGGKQRDRSLLREAPYHDIRRHDRDQWRVFLGPRLEALRPTPTPSPKLEAPGSRFAYDGFATSQGLVGDGFQVVGSLARGGLSGIWGAGIATWGDGDLADFPLSAADVVPSYRRVAERIGISGFCDDDLSTELDASLPSLPDMPLAENARRLLARYERRRQRVNALGIKLGRARAAVLSQPASGRAECTRCDMCFWGCSRGAIYSAEHDLEVLCRRRNFDYRPGWLVGRVRADSDGYAVTARRIDPREAELETVEHKARRIVLAAGTLASTRLALDLLQRYEIPVAFEGTPTVGFALCLPERLGAPISTREYSMGQISFLAYGDSTSTADGGYGSLVSASGIPGALTVDRIPLTRRGAVTLFRYLQPSLLLGNCFLPSRYGRNTAVLEQDGNGPPRLIVRGGVSEELPDRLELLKRQLRRAFGWLGAVLIPSSFSVIEPGQDLRPSGTLPMRARPGPGEVDPIGELHGSPGVHVVDLSIFPAQTGKHQAFTMMAIADRIGRRMARG